MILPIVTGPVTLRRWRASDVDDLATHGDSRAVWRNMLHTFPHPYTRDAADEWVARCLDQDPARDLVIALDDRLIGVCGIDVGEGVSAFTGRVGYWLGESHWGKGYATAAFAGFLDYVWETFDAQRLQAEVFAWNPASARVLEKNGFVLEGIRRQAIYKDGEFVDEVFYSLLRSDVERQ